MVVRVEDERQSKLTLFIGNCSYGNGKEMQCLIEGRLLQYFLLSFILSPTQHGTFVLK
jgi:hypothetical protein